MPAELRQLWHAANRHPQAPALVPLLMVAVLATAADLAIAADYLYDYARGLDGMGASPVDRAIGPDAHRAFAPLVLAFLMLGVPGTLYLGVLVVGLPMTRLARWVGR